MPLWWGDEDADETWNYVWFHYRPPDGRFRYLREQAADPSRDPSQSMMGARQPVRCRHVAIRQTGICRQCRLITLPACDHHHATPSKHTEYRSSPHAFAAGGYMVSARSMICRRCADVTKDGELMSAACADFSAALQHPFAIEEMKKSSNAD